MDNKQYKHILVPLDSSELAELALTDALGIARLSQAKVTLLHILSPIEKVLATGTGYPVYVDQQWNGQKMMALEYLNDVCNRMGCEDLTVYKAVEMGPAAEMIIDYARRHPVDLLVMATHGRSGLQRWVYGSVADKVLRGADIPVLLVRSHQAEEMLA